MIAALYVQKGGCYFGLEGVEPWDEARDARTYAGPWPVVAHPPCERWGRYWSGGPSATVRRKKGDDGGCFASALASVRKWGGVLEHPEASSAYAAFGLIPPARWGAWTVADFDGGWTCCVEQGAYGHRARKATWLYANGVELPSLKWGRAPGEFARMNAGFHSAEERSRASRSSVLERLSGKQRAATPRSVSRPTDRHRQFRTKAGGRVNAPASLPWLGFFPWPGYFACAICHARSLYTWGNPARFIPDFQKWASDHLHQDPRDA